MLYIVIALKAEAQAFVDMYKLKKQQLDSYMLFINENITLIISGMGVSNAKNASKVLMKNFTFNDDDIFLNIGICGASREYKIGELLEISSIRYKKEIYLLNKRAKKTINCVDFEVSEDKYEIVDMESFGFYESLLNFKEIKNIYILKVVSDHFEPTVITKDKAKQLIFKKIDEINRIINR